MSALFCVSTVYCAMEIVQLVRRRGMSSQSEDRAKTLAKLLTFSFNLISLLTFTTTSKIFVETAGRVCDDCNSTYHSSRLIHPLSELPRGEWRCPRCVARVNVADVFQEMRVWTSCSFLSVLYVLFVCLAFNVISFDLDEILVQACLDTKMVTRGVRGKKTSHVSI